MRQWMAESVLAATAAGGLGLLLATWTRDVILLLRPPLEGLQNLDPNVPFDARVLAFTALVAIGTAVLAGGLPAWRAARLDITTPLKEGGLPVIGGPRRSLAQGVLVVAQVAVSVGLLVSGGLLARSLAAASAFPPGFDASNLVIAQADSSGLDYTPDRRRAYYRETWERVAALPGVGAVTLAAVVPLGDARESRGVAIDDYTPPDGKRFVSIATNVVATNYFEVMSIPLVRGRAFEAGDGDDGSAVVAVVNETMARRYWRDGNPLGRRIQLGDAPAIQIVGVVRDIPYHALGEEPRPYLYLPFGPITVASLAFHVRAEADAGLVRTLTRELRASDARVRVPVVMAYDELRQIPLHPSRLMATVSGAFGALTVLLALVGLYGVVVYSVSQRTREFAVRMALGARPGEILRGVLGSALWMTGGGVALGVAVAVTLARLLRGFLFGISPFDPVTFGSSVAFVVVIALTAAYVPARRSTRIDAAAALTGRAG
jgi:predicted permease